MLRHPLHNKCTILLGEFNVHAVTRVRPDLPLCSADVTRIRLDTDTPALVVLSIHDQSWVGNGLQTANERPLFEAADDGEF